MAKDKLLKFDSVRPDDNQIRVLYNLLEARKYNISHREIPSYDEHTLFVKAEPYRAWYIILYREKPIGSVYLTEDNSVGLNIEEEQIEQVLSGVINFVLERHKPNPGLKSLRCDRFSVNVSPSNKKLISAMEKSGAEVIQICFALE
jgi:hypothetical protein